MKTLKNLFVAAALLALTAVPAAAGLPTGPHHHPADAGLVFELDSTMPLELAELSRQEMIKTEGEFVPAAYLAYALVGGAISAWTYHGTNYVQHGELGTSSGAAAAAGRGIITTGIGGGIAQAARLSRPVSGYLHVKTFATDQLMQTPSRYSNNSPSRRR